MPTLYKYCKCGVKISMSQSKCAKCTKVSAAIAGRIYNTHYRNKEAAKFYQSKEWRAVRNQVIKSEPFCRICGAAATLVDHIIPIEAGGAKLKVENLQPLCQTCHNKKTAKDKVLINEDE